MYTSSRRRPIASMILVSNCRRDRRTAPFDVFVRTRRFAHEHQVGIGVTDAVHDLLTAKAVQLAPGAIAQVLPGLLRALPLET